MLDLKRLDARKLAIARLQPGDDAPRFVTQHTDRIQSRIVSLGDEPAIPRQQRRILVQRRLKLRHQRGKPFAAAIFKRMGAGADRRRQILGGVGRADRTGDSARRRQAVANGGEVARTAAPQRKPRQGSRHVRRFLQRRAEFLDQIRRGLEKPDGVEARGDFSSVRQRRRDARGERPRARPGDGAVHRP